MSLQLILLAILIYNFTCEIAKFPRQPSVRLTRSIRVNWAKLFWIDVFFYKKKTSQRTTIIFSLLNFVFILRTFMISLPSMDTP